MMTNILDISSQEKCFVILNGYQLHDILVGAFVLILYQHKTIVQYMCTFVGRYDPECP